MRATTIPNRQLKRLREAHGLSQAKLAKLAGCGQSDVAKLETGATRTTAEWAIRLSPPLGVEPQDLFPTSGDTPYPLDLGNLRVSISVAHRMAAAHGILHNETAVSGLAAAIYDVLAESKMAGAPVVDDHDAIALIERVLRRTWQPQPD